MRLKDGWVSHVQYICQFSLFLLRVQSRSLSSSPPASTFLLPLTLHCLFRQTTSSSHQGVSIHNAETHDPLICLCNCETNSHYLFQRHHQLQRHYQFRRPQHVHESLWFRLNPILRIRDFNMLHVSIWINNLIKK